MPILDTLLSEIESSDVDEQVKQLCDQIMDEERGEEKQPYRGPDGPNVFLTLEIGKDQKEIFFLTLEREEPEKYIVAHYAKKRGLLVGRGMNPEDRQPPLKRIKAWEVKQSKAAKIVTEFAKKLKYLRGE